MIERLNSDSRVRAVQKEDELKNTLTMIYWKGDGYWLGKLREHPEIMTQGETLEELEENIRDAYQFIDIGTHNEVY